MITVYAIVASLLLGGFIRHNFKEMRNNYRWYRLKRKNDRKVLREQKQAEEAAAKDKALHLPVK